MSSDHAGGVDEVSLRWTRHAKVEVGAGRHRAGRVAMVHLRLEVKPGGVRVLDVERPRPNPIRAAAAETGARLPVEMRVRHLAVVLVGVVLAGLALWTFGLGASGKGPTLINPEDGTINVAVTQAGSGTWVPYLITVRNLGTRPARATRFDDASFPRRPVYLSGLLTIVMAHFQSARLSPEQIHALRDFVGFGGSLVIAGGPDLGMVARALPPELVPLAPGGSTTVAGLGPVGELAGLTANPLGQVATGTLVPGLVWSWRHLRGRRSLW